MTSTLLIIVLILQTILIILFLIQKNRNTNENKLNKIEQAIFKFENTIDKNEKTIKDEFQRNRYETNLTAKEYREELSNSLKSFEIKFNENTRNLNEQARLQFCDFNKQQTELNKNSLDSIKDIKETIEKQLKHIREDNSQQLNEIKRTVDEKLHETLEKRLGESFRQVSERLEEVHKGLGEMQTIATGVGDLKRVLSNVKTRGVLGEYQLGNILEQLLTPEQYSKNVATKKGSQANVEFAIKLPGKANDEEVWMPIDSKFPIESYEVLLNAYDSGDKLGIENSQKILFKSIESFAKDINTKYLDPPHTTDFAIMFLPIESLYAEVLRHPGFFEILQRKYRITVTGPTTLSALLNSLQMGFRTLAVQKRSSEVWKILEAVKTEFEAFANQLAEVDKSLNTASTKLQKLRTTRTSVMSRKLRDISILDSSEAKEILEFPKKIKL